MLYPKNSLVLYTIIILKKILITQNIFTIIFNINVNLKFNFKIFEKLQKL